MTICVGTFTHAEAISIRQSYREDCGRNIRVRFRGRGIRIFQNESGTTRQRYRQDLPLRYAERIAVYIDIVTEEDRNRIRENNQRRIIERRTATRFDGDIDSFRISNTADWNFGEGSFTISGTSGWGFIPKKIAQKKEIKMCGLAKFCKKMYK